MCSCLISKSNCEVLVMSCFVLTVGYGCSPCIRSNKIKILTLFYILKNRFIGQIQDLLESWSLNFPPDFYIAGGTLSFTKQIIFV